jgi:cytosine/adenosine deaminase-related metal-dependent hydrolase
MSEAARLPIGPRYVLHGRVVTMSPQGVLSRGAVYLDSGEIVAVQRTVDPPPPGFGEAPRVSTGGSLYPGLIELHNHLSYNAMPLWDVPRKYTNSGQWKSHPDYRRLITKPSQVLGRTAGIVEALVRYVECRCLLGGVTTSQGVTLANAGGIVSFYNGYVRNVEQATEPGLPRAGTRIANPDNGRAHDYLSTLRQHTCYLQHLSEGTDATARGWFHRLRLDSGEWAITDALCGIHSTALDAEDFRVMGSRGGSMVWSPMSNLLLYGGTADMRTVKDAGVLIGIGCDWAPSGSKNLLGELKVAWLVSEEQGGVFTAEEIVAMATVNAAKILKWDAALGTIAPGKRADLICLDGQQGDDYLRLIRARETSITLVIIDGVPRAGQPRLMRSFELGTEDIRVGRSIRVLNLEQETAHPLVRDVSLGEASRRLRHALHNLPALAAELDTASAHGLFSGSVDDAGTAWRVVFDFEEEDRLIEEALGLASVPLAEQVQPLELDGITVADDTQFLRRIVASRNLPEYVKKGLPPLYGLTIPLPESAGFLLTTPQPLPPQMLTTQSLKDVVRISGELRLEDRKTIVDQALLLLEENYVHLPLKRAMHAVDPVQRLRLLRHRLEDAREEDLAPEMEFHDEMTRIFNSLRDLHTSYRLPSPFKQKTAWLPFLVEEVDEHGVRKYLATKVVADAGPDTFVPGVEVLYWNGTPIDRVIQQNAHWQPGGNAAARHARGLNTLTLRPLVRGLAPDEEWVTLRYLGLDGAVHEWTQEWLVFEPGRSATSLDPESLLTENTALGIDAQTDDVQEAKKVLFAGGVLLEEMRAGTARRTQAIRNASTALATFLPMVFRAHEVTTDAGTFGYIRIFTFNVRDAREFVDEFVRLIDGLPQNGLIIDVRGNAGGLIHAAERLLQVLTPRRIEPQKAQFINTPLNLQLCRNWRHPSPRFPDFSLHEWVESIAQAVETGSIYSLGFPITPEDAANDIGQRYCGPKILITDALCYSATDMFAAAFQDHGIGPILGVDHNTGAGGANVWSHRLLLELMRPSARDSGAPYVALPHGADLRVAMRRVLRVGAKAGTVVEDLGIVPDHFHAMTRNDVLHGNIDLIAAAGRILASSNQHSLKVRTDTGTLAPTVRVETHNVEWITVVIDGRPRRSYDVHDGVAMIDLDELISAGAGTVLRLEIQAFHENELVAAARKELVTPHS